MSATLISSQQAFASLLPSLRAFFLLFAETKDAAYEMSACRHLGELRAGLLGNIRMSYL